MLKEVYLSRNQGPYYGPDECIDDTLEHKYFDTTSVSAPFLTVIHLYSFVVGSLLGA